MDLKKATFISACSGDGDDVGCGYVLAKYDESVSVRHWLATRVCRVPASYVLTSEPAPGLLFLACVEHAARAWIEMDWITSMRTYHPDA